MLTSRISARAALVAVLLAVTACASPRPSATSLGARATGDVPVSPSDSSVPPCQKADLHIRPGPQNIARGAPWDLTRVAVDSDRACTQPTATLSVGGASVPIAADDPGRSDHTAPPAPDRMVAPGHTVVLSIAWSGGTRDTPGIVTALHLGDAVVSLGHLLYWERGPITVSAPWREEDQPHTGTTRLETPDPATQSLPPSSTSTESLDPRASMHPTEFYCPASATPGDLTDLATGSNSVIEATVTSSESAVTDAGTASSGVVVRVFATPIVDVKVIARRGTATPEPTTIIGSDMDWSKSLLPGRYLIFLLDTGAPTNGMRGIFRIRNERAEWMCPSANDPAHPSTPPGTPSTLSDVESLVPRSLPTFDATKPALP